MLNPGSPEAIKKGCLCSTMANKRGLGYRCGGHEPLFVKNDICPLHGVEAEMKEEFEKEHFHTNEMEENDIINEIKKEKNNVR